METFGVIILFAFLIGGTFYGLYHEVQHMKAAVAKEQKQTALYEALLKKLEEV